MNKEIASVYFPLYKTEISEYFDGIINTVSDALPLRILSVLKIKKSLDEEWEEVNREIFNSFELSRSYISLLYNAYKNSDTIYAQPERKLITNISVVANRLPLRKVEVEEYLYGRDGGSPWADPENDIRKNSSVKYYIKNGINSNWILDYSQGYGDFLYALSNINRTIADLEMIPFEFDPRNNRNSENDIVMFSTDGHMFEFGHHYVEGKSIYGPAITDFWDDYNDDNIGKFNYVESYVFLYKKDEIVLFMNNFYMNAKKIISTSRLKGKHDITDIDIAIMSDKVKKWFKNNFPNAKCINTWGGYYSLENI